MRPLTLGELVAKACPEFSGRVPGADRPVAGVESDSRKVGKDFVFVAIRGSQADGSAYVREAMERGALAVVGERAVADCPSFLVVPEARLAVARLAAVFYGDPSASLEIVGVTGTNGKTTVSYLIEHLLADQDRRTGVIGTVNYRYAGREIPADETTPGPVRTQAILAEMVRAGCRSAVMEVSSHALDQHRVAGIDFRTAVFTNLTQDHLDYHGSLDAYFDCKARLFEGLRPSATAVLNADDPRGAALAARTSAAVRTYGFAAAADLRVADVRPLSRSTAFTVTAGGRSFPVDLPLIGAHNVSNALAALGAAASLGADPGRAARALASFPGVPGRLEAVDRGQDFSVYVDFAHTPDGLESVLASLTPYRHGKLILVFGCGGDRDRGKRPLMAAIAARFCDRVIVTSDNPRGEDPRSIIREVTAGFPAAARYEVQADRRRAIRQALLAARRDDIVLLAGKGHERVQIVNGVTHPFSDREEAEKVLDGR